MRRAIALAVILIWTFGAARARDFGDSDLASIGGGAFKGFECTVGGVSQSCSLTLARRETLVSEGHAADAGDMGPADLPGHAGCRKLKADAIAVKRLATKKGDIALDAEVPVYRCPGVETTSLGVAHLSRAVVLMANGVARPISPDAKEIQGINGAPLAFLGERPAVAVTMARRTGRALIDPELAVTLVDEEFADELSDGLARRGRYEGEEEGGEGRVYEVRDPLFIGSALVGQGHVVVRDLAGDPRYGADVDVVVGMNHLSRAIVGIDVARRQVLIQRTETEQTEPLRIPLNRSADLMTHEDFARYRTVTPYVPCAFGEIEDRKCLLASSASSTRLKGGRLFKGHFPVVGEIAGRGLSGIELKCDTVRVPSVSINGRVVVGMAHVVTACPEQDESIIGLDVMDGLVLTLLFRERRDVGLVPPAVFEGKPLPWRPLERLDRYFLVPVEVGGIAAMAQVDTGAILTLVDPDLVLDLGDRFVHEGTVAIQDANGHEFGIEVGRVEGSFKIAGIDFDPKGLMAAPVPGPLKAKRPDVRVILGSNHLIKADWFFDLKNDRWALSEPRR
ncbi:MAG: retropepsin-like domain-containing protein [Alphaproteobacteria bacterium]|nr:retropepsin-like domain-containing protein [Alphaproteobacteria bacterium]